MALIPSDPQQRQKFLLGVLLLVGVAYAAYTWGYAPRAAEVATLQERLDVLETQNVAARAMAAGGGAERTERQLAQFREQLIQVERLIPSSEELPDLLDAISAEARRTGVDLSLIQPSGATAEEFYTRRTYDLAVLGTYHDVGQFLTRVASLPRIITPINLNLSVQEEAGREAPRLQARFSIETYVLPSQGSQMDTSNAD